MTTVHLVYPHGPSISCPDAIGRQLGRRLAGAYDVRHHDWDGTTVVRPRPGDVLVGHPHPAPLSTFRRSAAQPGWRRVLMLAPYHHGDAVQVAWAEPVLRRSDLWLAVTGDHWSRSITTSVYAHWAPRMVHVDLAVDRGDFPALDRSFNPPGQRRFLYIGHTGWPKNTAYLAELAARLGPGRVAWMGKGPGEIPGVTALGYQDFATDAARRLVARHDFVLSVSGADANPSTILEGMAWGLVPVCTPESGYDARPGIVNLPLGDVEGAARVLRRLDQAPTKELERARALNWEALDRHFNWDRFAAQVTEAIERDDRPALLTPSWRDRTRLGWSTLASPFSPLHPRNARLTARALAPGRPG